MTDRRLLKVVFDTNTVISALAFTAARLAWLREHWRERHSIPLVSRSTAAELKWVLGFRKLKLTAESQLELLSDYLSYCETVELTDTCPVLCRDAKDQPFLDLAHIGTADVLVTGDDDLLTLAGQTAFAIETPEEYRQRTSSTRRNLR